MSLSVVPEVIFRESYELFITELGKGSCYAVLLARWVSKENFGHIMVSSDKFLIHSRWAYMSFFYSPKLEALYRKQKLAVTTT